MKRGLAVKLNGVRTRWWWVRHAPVPVAGKVVYGRHDVACDCSDVTVFEAQAPHLPAGAVVLTSGLSRARLTLAALANAGFACDASAVLTEPAFEERYFGNWEGLTWDEIEAAEPGAPQAFWDAPYTYRPSGGGENAFDHAARVGAAVKRISAQYPGRDIVAVAHAGSIRAQLANVLQMRHEDAQMLDIDFVSITRIDHYSGDLEGIARIGAVNVLHV